MNITSSYSSIKETPSYLKMRVAGLEKRASQSEDNKVRTDLFFFSTIHFYSGLPLSQRHVVIMGCVFPDGVGDYHHILNTAEWIKSKFPLIQVSIFANHMDERFPIRARKPNNPEIQVHFCNTKARISDDIYTMLENADYIIEMSQQSNDPDVMAIIKKKGKYFFIGEYGMRGGIGKQSIGMGINADQAGIIIKDPIPETSLAHLNHLGLKKVLFGRINPSEADLKNYYQTHFPFFAYLKMGSYYQTAFIYLNAALLSFSRKQVADIIIPKVKTEFLDKEFLKKQGIGKIQMISFGENQISIEETLLSPKGLILRLIDPFPLEQPDFYTLMRATSQVVGCTGDHSLSEVLSFRRIPFYEVREMKVEFWQHMINLSQNQKAVCLNEYFNQLYNLYDDYLDDVINVMAFYDQTQGNTDGMLADKITAMNIGLNYFKEKQKIIAATALQMAKLLIQPEIGGEYQRLNAFLAKNCSFNPVLTHIVERKFALASNPFLEDAVESIEDSYLSGEITIQEARELLSVEISRSA